MQPNTVVLPVDLNNDGNTVNQTYERYEETQNRTAYIGENHVPENRDLMTIYRTFPTRSGNFRGASKSSAKFTQDVVVAGVDASSSLTSSIIMEISASIPVGADANAVRTMRQRLIALLDNDVIMDGLQIQLMV